MNNQLTIRKANIEDITKIIDLGEKLQNESKEFETNLIFNKDEAMERYKNELQNDNALIIVAEEDKEIIGYQYNFISELDYLSHDNLECTFEAIYIIPEQRAKGISKKLMAFSENWAINDKKVNRIKSNIYSGNIKSEKLHEVYGFKSYNIEYIKLIQ